MKLHLAEQPYYYGEVWVDATGAPVTGREPAPSDFIAFQPPPYRFNGTIPVGRTTPGFDDHAYADTETRRNAYIQHVLAEAQNFRLLEQAVFRMAQASEGRRLLALAHQNGFNIVFDQRLTDERSALGLLDYKLKQIPVSPHTDPDRLARTLQHELTHMEDIANGLTCDAYTGLSTTIKIDRAMEASARVGEARLAVATAIVGPGIHPRQYRPTGILHSFIKHYPAMGVALLGASSMARTGRWDRFSAAVFPAYYQEKTVIRSYENDLLKFFMNNIPQKPESGSSRTDMLNYDYTMPRFMSGLAGAAMHDRLRALLKIDGKPYLPPASAAFDLDAPPYAGLTAQAMGSFHELAGKVAVAYHGRADQPRLDPGLIDNRPPAPPAGFFRLARAIATRLHKGAKLPAAARALLCEPDAAMVPLPVFQLPNPALVMPNARNGQYNGGLVAAFATQLARNPLRIQHPVELFHTGLAGMAKAPRQLCGNVERLVDLGLRAPIAAFPDAYIQGMLRRLDAVDAHARTPVSEPAHMALLRHWQALAAHGIDPVTGDTVAAGMPRAPSDNAWAETLGAAFLPVAHPAQPPAVTTLTYGQIKDWARDNAATLPRQPQPVLLPERRRKPVIIAAVLRQ